MAAGGANVASAFEAGAMQDFRRMPVVFGPAGGPRNLPASKESLRYAGEKTSVLATAIVDAERLAGFLPSGFRLDGEARLSVNVSELRNLGWLAGRGYKYVMVSIPVLFDGNEGTLAGDFLAVVWENLTEPILSGREELGYPKVYGDIDGPSRVGDAYRCSASWQGHRFFELEVQGLGSEEVTPSPRAKLVQRYVPNAFGAGPKLEQVLAIGAGLPGGRRAAPDGRLPEISIDSCRVGSGSFSFRSARWEDMPTQHHIVNALEALPILGFEDCLVITSTGQDDLSDVRELGSSEP